MHRAIVLVRTVHFITYTQPQSFKMSCILVEYPCKLPPLDHHEEMHSLRQTDVMVNSNLLQEITRL